MVGGQGKELCDLLVVCGDDVIIFSDKTIEWPDKDLEVAWGRWYKRSIQKSVDQVNGAARWIRSHPDRIFLDRECTQRFPIPLRSAEDMRLHGVVVARGTGHACQESFGEGTGSLLLFGTPADRTAKLAGGFPPFTIGDVNPDKMFVHVLDDGSLEFVMTELDTIGDLTDYLTKKEALIRDGQLGAAHGKEDLVAYYQTHMTSDYEHGFSRPDHTPLQPNDLLAIEDAYTGLRKNPQYIAKKKADEISYLWDRLIEAFTDNMLAGTTLVPDGETFELSTHELGVRYMALEPRFRRRNLGSGIADALEQSRKHDRFTRAFIQAPQMPASETGFFFLTLIVPDFEIKGGYDEYRQVRRGFLETYALSFLQEYPHLERIIGIATEPLPKDGGSRKGASEDLIYAERPEWTDELLADLAERRKHLDVMKKGQYSEYPFSGQEFPDVPPEQPDREEPTRSRPNRKQRWAMAARARRKKKRKT